MDFPVAALIVELANMGLLHPARLQAAIHCLTSWIQLVRLVNTR